MENKTQRTQSEIIPEVKNEFKEEEHTYKILGNTGGDYIKTQLPKDFFQNVLFGEMSLEYDFSIDKLTNLMDLYSLGIQYFLENNPIQAKYFQDRMGFILTNKDTLSNLKKQQEHEEKEKKEKLENKKDEKKKEFPKSTKNLPMTMTRKRALTSYLVKSQAIKSDEIKKKVSFVMNDSNKIKEDKKNIKNIIKDDLNKQNLQWKEKLKKKRENFNDSFGFTRKRNRTTFVSKKKIFQTPGPSEGRSFMNLSSPSNTKSPNQNKSRMDLSQKLDLNTNNSNINNMNNIDVEISEFDDLGKNEEESDVLKEIKERHSIKSKNKEDKRKKIENDDNSDSDSDSDSSSESKNSEEFLKQIEEVDEEKEPLSHRQTIREEEELNKKENEDNKDKDIKNENNNNIEIHSINNNKQKEKEENNENSISTQTTEIKNDISTLNRKVSIVDEKTLIRKMEPEKEIINAIEEKMQKIENINNNNNINKIETNNKPDEEENEGQSEVIDIKSNNISNTLQDTHITIDDIPPKFQETYTEVEITMDRYVNNLNEHIFKDTFDHFSLELKELYDKKYQKYIEVNNEYHNSIAENEFVLETDETLNEEKKNEIHQIIDSLKEEQKDQIDKITDEYNQLIDSKIRDFKQTLFKKDCGINLMEEQLRLDIFTLINEAFY